MCTLLESENGLFAFEYQEDLVAILDKVTAAFNYKFSAFTPYRERILRDFFDFWHFYAHGDSNFASANSLREEWRKEENKLLGYPVNEYITRTFLLIKLAEFKNHIQHIKMQNTPPMANKELPCYFIQHEREDIFLTPLISKFDEKGFLLGIQTDVENAASELFSKEIGEVRKDSWGRLLIGEAHIENFKEVWPVLTISLLFYWKKKVFNRAGKG